VARAIDEVASLGHVEVSDASGPLGKGHGILTQKHKKEQTTI